MLREWTVYCEGSEELLAGGIVEYGKQIAGKHVQLLGQSQYVRLLVGHWKKYTSLSSSTLPSCPLLWLNKLRTREAAHVVRSCAISVVSCARRDQNVNF